MTPNKEDYLKCIYELSYQHQKVTNKAIAQLMSVSFPAVTDMMKKLILDGLVEKDKQRGFLVTDTGMLLVSDIIRKHRLIEVFLMRELNYSIEELHQEAEILEHSVSDKFIDRLETLMHFPTHCPHGGKIPRKNEILQDDDIPLNRAKPGLYQLSRMIDDIQLIEFVKEYQLEIGSNIELIEHNEFAKITKIKINNTLQVLSDVIASQLFVEMVE